MSISSCGPSSLLNDNEGLSEGSYVAVQSTHCGCERNPAVLALKEGPVDQLVRESHSAREGQGIVWVGFLCDGTT